LEKGKEMKVHLVCFQGLLRKYFCDFAYLNVLFFWKFDFLGKGKKNYT